MLKTSEKGLVELRLDADATMSVSNSRPVSRVLFYEILALFPSCKDPRPIAG